MTTLDWRFCQQPGSTPGAVCGAAVATLGRFRCLAHLNDEQRAAYLTGLAPGADINVSGVTFTHDLLAQLLAALSDHPDSPAQFGTADFSNASFIHNADFRGASFAGAGKFAGATFHQDADFAGAVFSAGAYFSRAKFSAITTTRASFRDVTFHAGAYFEDAMFAGRSGFGGAVFTKDADFTAASFRGAASFDDSTFSGDAYFARAVFAGVAIFNGASFSGLIYLTHTVFSGQALFWNTRVLGTARVACRAGELDFQGMEVSGELEVEAAARAVHAQRMRGAGRVALRVRAAAVNLEGLACSGPVTLQGLHDPIPGVDETGLQDAVSGRVPKAAVTSLQGVDAERLVLTDMDLSRCLFAGMHHIEKLRLDGRCTFARDPRRRRQALAEEHHWRATRATGRTTRWTPAPEKVEPPGPMRLDLRMARPGREATWGSRPVKTEIPDPARLEVIYRQLRIAIESSKNEPGAADFYYGEMEMRRHSKTAPRPERAILHLYWLTSGYGLRASRAISALLLAIAVATVIFATVGFARPSVTTYQLATTTSMTGARPGWGTALYHAIDSSTSLLRTPEREALTPAGQSAEIALRLVGPALLGLAVLAVRGRVKR